MLKSYRVKETVDLKELEKFGFEYATDDRWCGTDEEIPRYEKDALIDDQGHSWGVCSADLKTRMICFDTEWWYGSFDDYVEREMEPLIKAGLIEEI